jgi:hypothetical protein
MPTMSALAYIVMGLYIPLVLALYQFMRPHRACIAAYLVGWLFLPMGSIHLHGVLDLTKVTMPSLGVLLATFLFDFDRLTRYRFRLWDIPMLVWTISPVFSSLMNHLGLYDAVATITNVWIGVWGLPYFLARIYFDDVPSLRDLAAGIVLGGLLYMPLCLWEIRMSPQLHFKLYGFVQHEFGQTRRDNGFRPMVFMQHGLALGMFMAMSTVIAAGLWLGQSRLRLLGVTMFWATVMLLVTTILCKSMGATIWMFCGLATVIMVRTARSPWALIAILLLPPIYMVTRATGQFTGQSLVNLIRPFNAERADSLLYRLTNEKLFVAKALQQPIEGYASTNWFPRDPDTGNFIGTPDGMWVIVLGKHGLIGLVSITLGMMIPVWLFIRGGRGFWIWDRLSHGGGPGILSVIPVVGQAWLLVWAWDQIAKRLPASAATMVWASSLACVVGLFMFDNLMNAMPNPLFVLAAGGLVSVCTSGALRVAGAGEPPSEAQSARVPLWRADGTSSLQPLAEFPEPSPFPAGGRRSRPALSQR